MKYLFLQVCLLTLFQAINAQSPQWQSLSAPEKEIVQVVINILDGMRSGDSAAVKKHFYSQVSANTAFINKQGNPVLKVDDINQWFNALAQPHDQLWDERIWDYEVRKDGNLASVWVKYAFYLDQDFHHCGVDAIQLANDGHGWKIFHIADTRRVTDCEIPAHIQNGATY